MQETLEQNEKPAQIARTDSRIYIIRAGRHFKVGISGNMAARLSQIRTDCPLAVKLLREHVVPIGMARQIEATAHAALSLHRHQGEWFKADLATITHAVYAAIKHHGCAPPPPADIEAEYERLMGKKRTLSESALKKRQAKARRRRALEKAAQQQTAQPLWTMGR